MKPKRKRGAPLGNQNARKHGFYSSSLTPDQICRFWNILNLGGVEPELVALRIKLDSALRFAPGSRRVIMEASKLLSKWHRARYNLDRKSAALFKRYIRAVLQAVQ